MDKHDCVKLLQLFSHTSVTALGVSSLILLTRSLRLEMAVLNRDRKRDLTKGTNNVVPEHRETWFLYEDESCWKSDRASDEEVCFGFLM